MTRYDAKFNGILFVSRYLIKKYGEKEAIRKTISRKKVKYFKL
jgi:hypothetical protein